MDLPTGMNILFAGPRTAAGEAVGLSACGYTQGHGDCPVLLLLRSISHRNHVRLFLHGTVAAVIASASSFAGSHRWHPHPSWGSRRWRPQPPREEQESRKPQTVRSCRWERQDPRAAMYRCGRGGGEAWMRASGRTVEGSCARISGTLEGKERNYFFYHARKGDWVQALDAAEKNSVGGGNRTINTRCKNWIR